MLGYAGSPSFPMDRQAVLWKVRDLFGRTHAFRDAWISDPSRGLEGEVSVEVGFGAGPAQFKVTAPSLEEVYAILYELATALLKSEKAHASAN